MRSHGIATSGPLPPHTVMDATPYEWGVYLPLYSSSLGHALWLDLHHRVPPPADNLHRLIGEDPLQVVKQLLGLRCGEVWGGVGRCRSLDAPPGDWTPLQLVVKQLQASEQHNNASTIAKS